MNIFYTMGLCAGLLFMTACAQSNSSQAGGGNLTGTVWSLSTLMGQQLVPDSEITTLFAADGKFGGSSGCNQYSGTYSVSGSKLEISSPLSSTMMACLPALMDQESTYLKALEQVKSFSINGDQLTLKDANGQNLLVYNAQSQDLSGTSWEVIGYNNGKQAVTSVLAGTALTAEFGMDGTLSGNSGCNTYSGSYTVNGNQITIGPLASTRMACGEPAGVMEQESQYLAALQSAATYKIEGNGLELRTADGALAVDFNKK